MIVIICATYKKNPFRTVDVTERTRFSMSRLNDLEDIGQGQRSSHAAHPLMLLIICTKYGKNPSWTVDATGRTRKVNRHTDGQTDRRTDGQTGWIQYTPPNFIAGGIKIDTVLYRNNFWCYLTASLCISVLLRGLSFYGAINTCILSVSCQQRQWKQVYEQTATMGLICTC